MRVATSGWWPSGEQSIDPDFRARASQIVAHFLEAWTVEEAGNSNEADDAFLIFVGIASRRVVAGTKNLPVSPSARNTHRDS